MNRNVESHFALNPTRIDISRSTFDRSSSLKTSFKKGASERPLNSLMMVNQAGDRVERHRPSSLILYVDIAEKLV